MVCKMRNFLLLLLPFVGVISAYDYRTYYYTQQVDHFSFENSDTFQQRYLVNNDSWNPDGGPIFFYTGNEGDIDWFTNNTGFMWDIAPEFKALLVFAEHRYYGESMPYGDHSYENIEYLSYFSAEQTLADFAQLLRYLKKTIPGAEKSPVVSFGGSYGGMLAAWFRMKYPHVTVGAISSSAPVLQFPGITACGIFSNITTNAFVSANPECAASIRNSWSEITKMGSDASGRDQLTQIFKLCKPLQNESDVQQLKDWLYETWGNVAMVNYPYPANFLNPLPAWPIKVMCQSLTNSSEESVTLLQNIFTAAAVYYNYTGSTTCMDIAQQGTQALGDLGWDYQSCAEMVMPMCNTGTTDMFEPSPWDYDAFAKSCLTRWNVTTRPDQIEMLFGGTDIDQYTNIVFSNGALDPWSGGGVTQSVSDSIVAIVIDGAAHHLDLRSANPGDPQSVITARDTEKAYIRKWITQARHMRKYKKAKRMRSDNSID